MNSKHADIQRKRAFLLEYLASDGIKIDHAVGTFKFSTIGSRLRLLTLDKTDRMFLFDPHVLEVFKSGRKISDIELYRLVGQSILYRLNVERFWHRPKFVSTVGGAITVVPICLLMAAAGPLLHLLSSGEIALPFGLEKFLTDDGTPEFVIFLFILIPIIIVLTVVYGIYWLAYRLIFDKRDISHGIAFRKQETDLLKSPNERREFNSPEFATKAGFLLKRVYSLYKDRGIDNWIEEREDEFENKQEWKGLKVFFRKQFSGQYKRIGGLLGPPIRTAFLPAVDSGLKRDSYTEIFGLRLSVSAIPILIVSALLLQDTMGDDVIISNFRTVAFAICGLVSIAMLWGILSLAFLRKRVNNWRKAKRDRFLKELREIGVEISAKDEMGDIRLAWGLESYILRSAYY